MTPGAPPEATSPSLQLDRLPNRAAPIEVVYLDEVNVGSAAERGARDPHRHDYHELIWMREGEARHLVDGRPLATAPGTITVIARGQVHVFERARALTAVIVRFGDEALDDGPPPALAQTVEVPAGDEDRLDALLDMLSAEIARPADPRTTDLQRHLLASLVLWVERWQRVARHERGDDGAARLHRSFAQLLERDFARHHETSHYADALGVPQAALSQALSRTTGQTTKQLITDRVMLEAARLLRFTSMSVNEVAYATGFEDQLYFSRAFKRHHGEPPTAYRTRLRAR